MASGRPSEGDDGEITEGDLSCPGGHAFPIINGIPRLLPPELLAETLKRYHPEHYESHQIDPAASGEMSDTLKHRTLRSFSYQWNVFSEMYQHWEDNFQSYFAPLLQPRDFQEKLVLDAGCGFGRQAYYAASYGAEVVAMDLSEAVEAAHANTADMPNVHVIQADLYHPPLRPRFDLVYSVGVIQHIPDPASGFARLSRLLKEGGRIFVWVYGVRRGLYRLVDLMRRVTTKTPLAFLYYVAYVLNIASFLSFSLPCKILRAVPGGGRLARLLPFTRYADLPLRVGHADWFDRLSVPSTVYFPSEEITRWYAEAGLRNIELESREQIGWRALGTR